LASSHDAGFDTAWFRTALRAIDRLPLAEFTAYGLSPADVDALKSRVAAWADEIGCR
jgi:hypothetical protein